MDADLDSLRNDDAAWDSFVASSQTDFPLQMTAWAAAKTPTGWTSARIVADGGSGPIGGQLLMRSLGPGPFAMGHLPRGPVATRFDESSVKAFTHVLREFARARCRTHVTADPGLEGSEPVSLLRAAGWRPSDDVQLDSTQVIDLARSEEELWSDVYKSSRRYANGARKRGCTVSSKLILTSGGRASQLYGGLSDAGGKARAARFFECEAIVRSKAAGATIFGHVGLLDPGDRLFQAGFRRSSSGVRRHLGPRAERHGARALCTWPPHVRPPGPAATRSRHAGERRGAEHR